MAMVGGGDVTDISNSPAYAHLDALVASGELREAQASLFKAKYAKLHDVVLRTYDHEKNLLRRAKQLNQDLLAEKMKLDKSTTRAQEDSDAIAALRDELTKGGSEASAREEREATLQLEVDGFSKQKNDLERDAAAKERLQAELLQPQIETLERATEEAATDLARQQATLMRLQTDRKELHERIAECRALKNSAEVEKGQQNATYVKVRSEPDKLKKQADVVAGAASTLEGDVEKLTLQSLQLEQEAALQARRHKELDETGTEHALAAERARSLTEAKERDCDQAQTRLELAREDTSRAEVDRVRLELEQKALASELKREQDGLNRRVKNYNSSLKRMRRSEMAMQQAQQLVPHEKLQAHEAGRQLTAKRGEKTRQLASIEEMRREVDIFINNFLKQEDAEKDQVLWLRQLQAEVQEYHAELRALQENDRAMHQRIAELNAAREAKSREAAKALQHTCEAAEEVKVRQLVLFDLGKRHHEIRTQLAEFSKLYDLVKNDRNKYVHLIQASGQGLAEMKEKIKILHNEVEILRRESAQKDASFSKEHLEHQNSTYARDALRIEQNKVSAALSEQTVQSKQQAEEVRNLNAIINSIEREMLRLKRQYEVAVEDRNYTGIQLIDRNDELCILYEKSNVQQQTLTRGELQLQARADEVRVLDLELARLCREIEAVRRQIPQMPAFEEQVLTLQAQLETERIEAERLSAELESPANERRWRKLEGRDPEPEALAAKIALLDERLNDKKEQLLEKELVLEEVTSLASRLRKQAIERREGMLELATSVNEVQGRVKAVTRKMMAAVSELSMYQAISIKLTHDNTQQHALLEWAQRRVDNGEAPTDEVEDEWQRYSLQLDRRHNDALSAAAAAAANGDGIAQTGSLVVTTAEARPNAYIPDDLGIPKPYGGNAPFKPSEAGSTMRHMRKPNPREIDI
ncbi:hypothetical protein T492DRAFT_1087320 [Pavlovales sp. CCMP2436]|nr:hypothetical protein T492DRAFT_1087320 [Pavlovales sp. CCMP2436]|mmetsp:Transcript_22339/g.56662  ORF Transcript_22339/g.56662 Transcript_22339/m.56662 type:complete len:928 (+) Transcript_22339:122-2905(+)